MSSNNEVNGGIADNSPTTQLKDTYHITLDTHQKTSIIKIKKQEQKNNTIDQIDNPNDKITHLEETIPILKTKLNCNLYKTENKQCDDSIKHIINALSALKNEYVKEE